MKPPSNPAPDGCAACGHEHLVSFYENEQFLVDIVTDYVAAGLRRGGATIVVATPEHQAAFADAIGDAGVDLATASDEGRYLAIDAADMLATFMVAGAPDPDRFRAAVIRLLKSVAAHGRDVRVYGEMVALLWAAGDITSTIALEDLWNQLAATHAFTLLCGYPISGFDVQSRTSFEHICGRHTRCAA